VASIGWPPTGSLTDSVNFRLLNLHGGEYLGQHPWLQAIVSGSGGALMLAGERSGHRIVALGFNPFPYLGRQNLPMSVLTLNSLSYLAGFGAETAGYHTGDPWIVPAGVDAIVSGRNPFETVLGFPGWPYGDKRVVVLSSRAVDVSKARGAVEQMGGPPADIASQLAASGVRHAYIDGGITVQRFLRDGLIQRLIITRVPVLIGDGIPLFGSLPHDVRLDHVATRHYPSGLVQSEYRIR